MFGVVVTSAAAQRALWLAEVVEVVERYFPKETS
jgi:hypothetical protein